MYRRHMDPFSVFDFGLFEFWFSHNPLIIQYLIKVNCLRSHALCPSLFSLITIKGRTHSLTLLPGWLNSFPFSVDIWTSIPQMTHYKVHSYHRFSGRSMHQHHRSKECKVHAFLSGYLLFRIHRFSSVTLYITVLL